MTFRQIAERVLTSIRKIALLSPVVLPGISGCGGNGGGDTGVDPSLPSIVVNSLLDDASPRFWASLPK